MAAHVHHQTPRNLLRLHHEASAAAEITGEGIEAWLEWEIEATRYGVDVEIAPEDLAELVESSTVLVPEEAHRNGHSEGGDFARWGRRGGLRTLQLYGTAWFSALALKRWGRLSREDLEAARPVRQRGIT